MTCDLCLEERDETLIVRQKKRSEENEYIKNGKKVINPPKTIDSVKCSVYDELYADPRVDLDLVL